MPDPAERFIEAAVSPLVENAELEIAGRHALEEAIANAGEAAGDSLEAAAEQLERADRQPHGRWWKYTLYAVMGIVSVGILGMSTMALLLFRQSAQVVGMFGTLGAGSDPDAMQQRLGRGLTAEQKLLLFGDTRRSGKADRFKGLWESDPENPAYYSDYVAAHLSERTSLPPDFVETGAKLDPDNAWFPIIAASEAARMAIDPSYSAKAMSPGGTKLKSIKDPAKVDEALALLHQAVPLQRFENYQLGLLKKRIPLLPKRTDSLDQLVPLTYVGGLTAPNLRLRHLSEVVAAKAIQQAKDKDVEGFKRMLADWTAFTETYVRSDHGTMIDVLVATVTIHKPLKAFHEAATDLGLPEEAARAKELDDRIEAWKHATRSRVDPNANLARHSSLLAGMALPVVSKQSQRSPVLSPEDLEPGRLADLALAGRILSLIGWLLLGVGALASALYGFRCSRLTRHLSDRLSGLLRPVDWAWMFGIGLLLPLLYHLAICRFTPLGGREWSLKASGFLLPAGQFSTMIWLMIVLPVMVARWRLARRGAAAGLAGGRRPLAWVAVLSGAAALPAFGFGFAGDTTTHTPFVVAGCLLWLLQLYGSVIGIRALFSRQASLLRRTTISRILTPAYAGGMLLMMVLVPLYHAEERRWMAEDRLMEVSAETPSMTRFEYDVTQAMKQELLELVTAKP